MNIIGLLVIFVTKMPAQTDPSGNKADFDRIEGNIFAFNGAAGAMGFDRQNRKTGLKMMNIFYLRQIHS